MEIIKESLDITKKIDWYTKLLDRLSTQDLWNHLGEITILTTYSELLNILEEIRLYIDILSNELSHDEKEGNIQLVATKKKQLLLLEQQEINFLTIKKELSWIVEEIKTNRFDIEKKNLFDITTKEEYDYISKLAKIFLEESKILKEKEKEINIITNLMWNEEVIKKINNIPQKEKLEILQKYTNNVLSIITQFIDKKDRIESLLKKENIIFDNITKTPLYLNYNMKLDIKDTVFYIDFLEKIKWFNKILDTLLLIGRQKKLLSNILLIKDKLLIKDSDKILDNYNSIIYIKKINDLDFLDSIFKDISWIEDDMNVIMKKLSWLDNIVNELTRVILHVNNNISNEKLFELYDINKNKVTKDDIIIDKTKVLDINNDFENIINKFEKNILLLNKISEHQEKINIFETYYDNFIEEYIEDPFRNINYRWYKNDFIDNVVNIKEKLKTKYHDLVIKTETDIFNINDLDSFNKDGVILKEKIARDLRKIQLDIDSVSNIISRINWYNYWKGHSLEHQKNKLVKVNFNILESNKIIKYLENSFEKKFKNEKNDFERMERMRNLYSSLSSSWWSSSRGGSSWWSSSSSWSLSSSWKSGWKSGF